MSAAGAGAGDVMTMAAGTRLLWASLVCVPLIAAVIAVEWPRPEVPMPIVATDVPTLVVTASAPVLRWHITIDGRELTAGDSDAWRWTGPLTAPAGSVVRIRAEIAARAGNAVAPGGNAAPHRAIRARIGNLPERTAWSDGNPSLILTVPAF